MAKKIGLGILVLLLGLAVVGTVSAQTTIQGAWELRTRSDIHIISFIDDTFAIFRNGEMVLCGFFTINPSSWGVSITSNHPRNIYMEFGVLESAARGFSYTISANELVLSDDGWRRLDPTRDYDRHFTLGTYRRSSEPSEARNQLIGAWRYDYEHTNGNVTQILRFFPNGKGTMFVYFNPRPLNYTANIVSFTYEFGATPGSVQVSLLRFGGNWSTMEMLVDRVLQFVKDGSVLRIGTEEYMKR